MGYLGSEVKVLENGAIRLPKLLMWYGCDFGSCETEILGAIKAYVSDGVKEAIGGGAVKVEYGDYDWKVNRSE